MHSDAYFVMDGCVRSNAGKISCYIYNACAVTQELQLKRNVHHQYYGRVRLVPGEQRSGRYYSGKTQYNLLQ